MAVKFLLRIGRLVMRVQCNSVFQQYAVVKSNPRHARIPVQRALSACGPSMSLNIDGKFVMASARLWLDGKHITQPTRSHRRLQTPLFISGQIDVNKINSYDTSLSASVVTAAADVSGIA